jgi:hypothetical protein
MRRGRKLETPLPKSEDSVDQDVDDRDVPEEEDLMMLIKQIYVSKLYSCSFFLCCNPWSVSRARLI